LHRVRPALVGLLLCASGCTTKIPDHIDLGQTDAASDGPAQDAPKDGSLPPDAPPPDVPDSEALVDTIPDLEPDVGSDVGVDVSPDGVTCPNGTCDLGEDDGNCPQDCGCAAAASCNDPAPAGCYCDVCSVFLSTACLDAFPQCGVVDTCGNLACDTVCGEDMTTCPGDC